MRRLPKLFITLASVLFLTGCSFSGDSVSISLNKYSNTINVGETFELVGTATSLSGKDYTLSFQSSNTAVATVSSSKTNVGLVSGLKSGSSNITCFYDKNGNGKFDSGEKKAVCVVTVDDSGSESISISLNKYSNTINVGETFELEGTATSLSGKDYTLSFQSSNTAVATVSSSKTNVGLVSGLKSGSSNITCFYDKNGNGKFDSGEKKAVCVVTVDDGGSTTIPVSSVSFNVNSRTLDVNDTYTLIATVLPTNATNKSLSWNSSNESVATVTASGLLTASSAGSTTITATSLDNPNAVASCLVTVNDGGDVPPSGKAAWTILIYMCGADLESTYANQTWVEGQSWTGQGLAALDIEEILSVSGKPDDINIVFQTGGASEWTNHTYGKYADYDIRSDKIQRHHVEKMSGKQLPNQLVLDQTLADANMGAGSTFQSFLEWGLETYPAEKTAVIFWDHGGAMSGACFDENHSNDGLLVSETTQAFSTVFSKKGISKLEWVGYDCCLMQVQDVAEKNSEFFNYMVASQESESGYGWAYSSWIDDLYQKKNTEVILKEICDGFIADNDQWGASSNDQTLSYLDLSYASAYKSAWESMATALISKLTSSNKSSFNSLVESAKYYADSDYEYFGVFDAKDFVNKLSNNSTFNPGSSYTSAVLNAFNNLVKYNKIGQAAGNSNGLSLFWACSANTYPDYYYTSDETNFTQWKYIVDNFGNTSGGGWGYGY